MSFIIQQNYSEVVDQVITEVLDRHIKKVGPFTVLTSYQAEIGAIELLTPELYDAISMEMYSEVASALSFRMREIG